MRLAFAVSLFFGPLTGPLIPRLPHFHPLFQSQFHFHIPSPGSFSYSAYVSISTSRPLFRQSLLLAAHGHC